MLLRTNNRIATRPDALHPVHRHDVGPARAPDRTALDDRRYRNEAPAIVLGDLLSPLLGVGSDSAAAEPGRPRLDWRR
jgi:hypothetical protein